MINFIIFEAESKEREIHSNAEQECEREKSTYIDKERKKIDADFQRKVKEAEVKKRIAYSQALSSSRLQLLEAEDAHVQTLMKMVEQQLAEETKKDSYEGLLEKLILEGIKKVEDTDITVKCRASDADKVKSAISRILKDNSTWTITLDDKEYLDDSVIGGVTIGSHGDKIVCNNTLEHRTVAALTVSLPLIRKTIFPSLKNQTQKNKLV